MPFRSEAQRRFLYSQHPEIAKEFEAATPNNVKLPEHVPQKMADGGLLDTLRNAFMGDKGETAVKVDANDAKSADAIDPVVTSSSDTAKGMCSGGYAEGGNVDKDEPGLQDVSATDFLLPFLLGSKVGMPEGLGDKLADEAGAVFPSKAPAMEDVVGGATTKDTPGQVEVYVKGIQKGAPGGSGDVKIYGVKGDPAQLKEMFGDEAPGSVPEHVLQAKGLLPQAGPAVPQAAPNAYAKGGAVNYPHVTFLENESPAKVKEVTHLKGPARPETMTETGEKKEPAHMSEGGKTPHFLEGLKKGALHKEMGISEDKKIPEKKLEKAANSDNETLRKRAQFAINAKKWHHAEGGPILSAEGRDKEPAKPANIEPSHEEKLKSIYKAMGMKKYADGGVADSDGTVDVSQLPGANTPPPSPSDPGFWDTIKDALAKVGAPFAGAANVAAAPAEAASTMAAAATPAVAGAVNSITGANLPVPAPTAPVAPPAAPSAALPGPVAPVMPPIAPTAAPTAPVSSGMPNLNTIFNQDTSKLTEGVNPEDRQALANKLQEQQHSLGSVIAQAVAGLGDALATKGGRDQHSLQNIFSMQKQQRDEALANFDQARQDRLQKVALQTQMGDNALKQAAAQDAYGVDENLNKLIGAPQGTMKKDLPTYFSLMSAQVAKQEKDADLYMKAHAQASTDVDNATKNASVLGIKPSAAQLQASGAKLADNYYNRAKGNLQIKSSDGQTLWIPAGNLAKAKQLDPNLQVQP